MMKRWYIVASTIGVLFVCGAVTGLIFLTNNLQGVGAQPHDEEVSIAAGSSLSNNSRDIGVLFPGESATVRFVVRNGNSVPMRFTHIDSACGCTRAVFNRSYLEAGREAQLTITVSAPDIAPRKLEIRIVIHATVGEETVIMPILVVGQTRHALYVGNRVGVIDLGQVAADDLPKHFEVPIRRGDYPMKWTTFHVEGEANLRPSVIAKANDQWTLALDAEQDATLGMREFILTFRFYDGDSLLPRILQRTVKAEIVGPVSAIPKSILIGGIRPGATYSGTIVVKRRSAGGGITVTDAHVNGPGEVKFMDAQLRDTAVAIPFVYTAPTQTGPKDGNMELSVDCDDHRFRLEVPFFAFIDPRIQPSRSPSQE